MSEIDKKETFNNPGTGNYFKLMGYYNINDVKYDLLKII